MFAVKPPSPDHQSERIAMLEAENEQLRERIEHLEREMFSGDLLFPVEWGLTGSEQRVVGVLLSRPIARKEQILTALYRDLHRDEPEIKIVDVFVCKIRKKVRPFGIDIRTIWGAGYSIDEPMKSVINKALSPDASPQDRAALRFLFDDGAMLMEAAE